MKYKLTEGDLITMVTDRPAHITLKVLHSNARNYPKPDGRASRRKPETVH